MSFDAVVWPCKDPHLQSNLLFGILSQHKTLGSSDLGAAQYVMQFLLSIKHSGLFH